MKEKEREDSKMEDKSLGIWLIVLFGVSGLAAISLGWLLPWLESDRIILTLGGLTGITIAIIRAFMLRNAPHKRRVAIEIEAEDKL